MEITVQLLQNVAILVALCLFQWIVLQVAASEGHYRRILEGVGYGIVCIVGMSAPFVLAPGVIFDSRAVVLSLGAAFGGPVTAIVSGTLAGSYRLYLGGDGALTGMAVVAVSVLGGLAFRWRYGSRAGKIGVVPLIGLGVVVHVMAAACFLLLPQAYEQVVFTELAPAYIVIMSAGTALAGLILQDVIRAKQYSSLVEKSESRFSTFFDSSSAAMLELDMAEPFGRVDRRVKDSVAILAAMFAGTPEASGGKAGAMPLLQANDEALKFFEAETEGALMRGARDSLAPALQAALASFPQEAVADGTSFTGEVDFILAGGKKKTAIVSFAIPRTPEQAARVAVTLLDTTPIKAAEAEVRQQRARLEHILWGTNAGTWEWNVQTGETRFNGRWAAIIGYNLAELEPISIRTWEELCHPDDLERSDAALQRVFEKADEHYECTVRMRHKNGRWIWVLDRGKVHDWTEDGKPLWMSGTHTDIDALKRSELAAQRHVALQDELRGIEKDIRAGASPEMLLNRAAGRLTESLGCDLAWIADCRIASGRGMPVVARSGPAAGFLEQAGPAGMACDSEDEPVAMAIRSRSPQTVSDILFNRDCTAWREAARACGLRSMAALPIVVGGEVGFILCCYSSEVDKFRDEELSELTELARILSLGFDALTSRAEQAKLRRRLYDAAYGAVSAIAATIESRDPYTSGHQQNVANLAVEIARKLGYREDRLEGLRLGAIIHDIGKIRVPSDILNSPRRLSDAEFDIVKTHPEVGYEILSETEFPWPIGEMVRQHHERFDGSGYPVGLAGDKIIEEARIIAVADVVDAITSHRPYRPGKGVEEALAEIEAGRGTRYDPLVADACIQIIRHEGFKWMSSTLGKPAH